MPKRRWGLLAGAAVLAAMLQIPQVAAHAEDSIKDPIPEDPTPSGLGLVVQEYASFPKSDPTPAPTDQRLMRQARINYIGTVPDGSGREYVPDLNGRMYLVENGVPHVYLDVGATFAPRFFSGRGMGQGFGFVTFDPGFKHNGKFYTVHTELASSVTDKTPDWAQANTLYHGIITEWTADDPAAETFQGTRREILRIGFATQIHGIQQIDFNPTAKRGDADFGLLYAAVGDGGIGVRNTEPQDLSNPYGKLLRIDPRGTDGVNGKYGIPASNPFAGKPGARGEIYAYGFRDPHRFSWDPGGTHRLFLGHIGEKTIEAVDDVRAGDNFGWSEREGPFRFEKNPPTPCDRLYPLPADDAKYGYTYPVAAYDHNPPPGWNCTDDVGRAISGGVVYRGHKLHDLYGKYIFGDIVDGRVFYTNEREMRRGQGLATIYQMMVYDKTTGKRVAMSDLSGVGAPGDPKRVDLRFSTDAKGELYLIAKANGKIWKVVGTRNFAACQTNDIRLSDNMAAANWAPVTPAKWQFPGREVVLAEAGVERPGPRRPFEYAVLSKGPQLGSVRIKGEVRLDTPVEVTNRDVIIVFGYRSDTQFYYAHLSTDNTIYPHNGIFVVNNADRLRLDDQWNATLSHGAPPSITDAAWHRVQVKHCADTGEIAVYVDGSKYPRMTAVDQTFDSGRVGFGSFDNIGRLRGLKVSGEKAAA